MKELKDKLLEVVTEKAKKSKIVKKFTDALVSFQLSYLF